ncbi:hypothetical protein EAO71_02610 [Streptomyces sp. ms191]|nr:hypothetical protein EAO71_02610 [Streptomyces sp. ms191]
MNPLLPMSVLASTLPLSVPFPRRVPVAGPVDRAGVGTAASSAPLGLPAGRRLRTAFLRTNPDKVTEGPEPP